MKTLKFALLPCLLALSGLTLSLPALAGASSAAAAPTSSETRTDQALRDLWLGHVFWIRNFVDASTAHNRAAAAAAEEQVAANAKAIAAAIEPFYGKDASAQLLTLLFGHYGAVKQYLDATLAGSTAQQQAATDALGANADKIARFLSGANPNLPYETLKGLLLAHGGHHIQQIQELAGGKYADEARTWEAMKNHMYVVADALTGALAAQFPSKFLTAAR